MWTTVVVWWMIMDEYSLRATIYYQFNGHGCQGGLTTRWTSLKKHCGELHRPLTEGVMWHRGNQIAAPSVSGLSKLTWREAWQRRRVVVGWVASIFLFHICQLNRLWSGIGCETSNRRRKRWVSDMEWAKRWRKRYTHGSGGRGSRGSRGKRGCLLWV